MHLDVQWQTDPRATILHALRLLADDAPRVDHKIISLLEPWGQRLRDQPLNELFWHELSLIATGEADFSRWVDEAAQRSHLECATGEIARWLEAAEGEVAGSDLDVSEELRLRQRPLREIWEASGPGMLFQIGRQTMRPIVSRLQVQGLLPLCGGFGRSFAESDCVQIELVLANPTAEVPEVVRLAWLVAQLSIPDDSNPTADQLALIPCCLGRRRATGYDAMPAVIGRHVPAGMESR